MKHQFRCVNFFSTEDPVLMREDQLVNLFDSCLITPFNGLRFFPVYIINAINVFYVAHEFSGDRVTYPVYELTVFSIGDLSGIHPEAIDRNLLVTRSVCKGYVLLARTPVEGSRWYRYHRRRLRHDVVVTDSSSMYLAVVTQS